eukprot:15663901-Heterocapsa_arctica.AAC.1
MIGNGRGPTQTTGSSSSAFRQNTRFIRNRLSIPRSASAPDLPCSAMRGTSQWPAYSSWACSSLAAS